MKLYTAHFNYQGDGRIDITVNTGLKAFKPTKEMVLGLRHFTLSKEEFTEQYRQMMIESRYNYSRHWYSLLMRKEATLVEYSPGTFTYRVLLAKWLQEWFPQYVRYMGERNI